MKQTQGNMESVHSTFSYTALAHVESQKFVAGVSIKAAAVIT